MSKSAMQDNTAVILLAYGSPESLSDIPAYLSNVRAGRQPSQDLIDRVTARYKRIGGRSPLTPTTRRIAQKLEKVLKIPVYTGMLHWHPYLEDTVAEMVNDGVKRMIAICLAPHYSELSIGKYHSRLADALHASGGDVDLHFVKNWHDQSDYLAGLAAHIRKGWERFPPEKRDQVKVIFTAHSLPKSFLKEDSEYQSQLQETARALAERLDLLPKRWVLAYQSAPQPDSSWLGPHVEILLKKAAQEGKRHILVAPIGFITDHLEILYDIDVKYQAIAQSQGMDLKRMVMLNDSPALVTSLASLVKRNLDIYD